MSQGTHWPKPLRDSREALGSTSTAEGKLLHATDCRWRLWGQRLNNQLPDAQRGRGSSGESKGGAAVLASGRSFQRLEITPAID